MTADSDLIRRGDALAEIRKELKQVRKELEGPVYQAGKKIAKWFTRF